MSAANCTTRRTARQVPRHDPGSHALTTGGTHVMHPRLLKAHSAARLEALMRDVAYALRQMRRAPGVALLAIVCLAVGIGVNTAIFGVVNAMLLRPMAVVDPERLVLITRGQGEAFS